MKETKFRRVDCQVNSDPVSREEDSFIPRRRKNLVISGAKLLEVFLTINQR